MKQPFNQSTTTSLTHNNHRIQDSGLRELQHHAKKLNYLTQLVKPFLPQEAIWHVAQYHNGMLTLACNSATFASAARYRQHYILHQLRSLEYFKHLQHIKIIVVSTSMHEPYHSQTQPTQFFTMSESTKSMITAVASSMQDEELSGLLLRLTSKSNQT